jgi:hypothetical protein
MAVSKAREDVRRSKTPRFPARIGQQHNRPQDRAYQLHDYHHGDHNDIDHYLHRRLRPETGKMTTELQGADRLRAAN